MIPLNAQCEKTRNLLSLEKIFRENTIRHLLNVREPFAKHLESKFSHFPHCENEEIERKLQMHWKAIMTE